MCVVFYVSELQKMGLPPFIAFLLDSEKKCGGGSPEEERARGEGNSPPRHSYRFIMCDDCQLIICSYHAFTTRNSSMVNVVRHKSLCYRCMLKFIEEYDKSEAIKNAPENVVDMKPPVPPPKPRVPPPAEEHKVAHPPNELDID